MASSGAGRNILIALDFTDESVRTVKWALGQHVRDGDQVTLLHVQPAHAPAAHVLPGPGPFAALWERDQEMRRQRQSDEHKVTERIQSWAQSYCPQGVKINWAIASVAPSAVAVSGDGGAARDCIITEAGNRKADCLILGSHRSLSEAPFSGLAALGMRSLGMGGGMPTSEYCAQHAPCPVIVVPPLPAPAAPVFDKSCAVTAGAAEVGGLPFLDSLAL